MKPIEFKEQNTVYAKTQEEYLDLPALKYEGNDGQIVFCESLSLKERIKLLFTGKLWCSILTFNNNLQPSYFTVNKKELINNE